MLAVINEIKKQNQDVEILYVGSRDGLESRIIPQTGIEFREISSGKFRRYHKNAVLNIVDVTTLFKNFVDMFRFAKGYFEAKTILNEFRPNVVFTKGGFVSLPVGLAAASLKYPLVVHESDSIMGLSNKLLADKAQKVCVSYPTKYYPEISDEALVYSGNPVREDMFNGSKTKAKEEFAIKSKKPVIMIIGGSQGALAINQLISESLRDLLPKYEIIHVAGERDFDWLDFKSDKIPEDLKESYHLYNFLSGNLKDAYAIADLVISRAGNNVIAELAALGKPTILIPLSSSANDHQLENARIISRMGAAILMLQEHLTPQKLVRQLELLFSEPNELKDLGERLHDLAKLDAAEIVANEVIRLGEVAKEQEEEDVEEG